MIQDKLLENAIVNNRIPQALIFEGKDRKEMERVAFCFIRKLNKDFKNYKEDIISLEDEEEEIKIDLIRDLQKKLSLKKQFSLYRAVIIGNAEKLNKEAQSCFLKTLEEPPENTIFILIVSDKSLLLSTIVSRVWVLKFTKNELSQKEIIKEVFEFLKNDLFSRLKMVEGMVKSSQKNRELPFMEGLVLALRKEMFQSRQVREQIKCIERTRKLFFTTNINKKLAMENIVFNT